MKRFKGGQRGLGALAPEPDSIGRILTLRAPLLVDGVILENVPRSHHHVKQRLALLARGQIGGNLPVGDVVRGRERAPRPAAFLDKAMAVGDARVQRKTGAVELLFQRCDQLFCLLRGDLARRVVQHGLLFERLFLGEGDEVAAQRDVGVFQGNADGRRLQGGAPRIIEGGVIAEHGEVGDVAARGKARGHGAHESLHAFFCKRVDVGLAGELQAGLVVPLGQGIARHAVAQDDNVFHRVSLVI